MDDLKVRIHSVCPVFVSTRFLARCTLRVDALLLARRMATG